MPGNKHYLTMPVKITGNNAFVEAPRLVLTYWTHPKWHAAFTAAPNFFLFLLADQRLYIVKNVFIYTHTCLLGNFI
jgi:hypothetical protein